MKLLLVIFATALAVGAVNNQRVLVPGYEYHFTYLAHALTGIPDVDEQYASVAMRAKILIQVLENHMLFKIKELEMAELNEDLDTVDLESIPYKFERVTQDEQFITNTVKIHLRDGVISEIEVSENAPKRITNIKKAIISMLIVNLKVENSREDSFRDLVENPLRLSAFDSYSNFRDRTGRSQVEVPEFATYEIWEDGILGKSESKYIIQQQEWEGNPTADVLNVTKIRTFEEIDEENEPVWLLTTNAPNNCSDCDEDDTDFVNKIRVIEYDLVKSEKGGYHIERIESTTQYVYAPLTTENDDIESNHTQILVLKLVKGIDTPLPNVPSGKKHPSLQYEFPEMVPKERLTVEHLKKRPPSFYPGKETTCQQSQILRLIGTIASTIYDNKLSTEDTPRQAMLATRLALMCSYDELKSITDSLVKPPPIEIVLEKIKKDICVDILAMTGSLPSLTLLVDLIKERKIVGEQAAQVLMVVPHYISEPCPVFILHFMSLLDSRIAKENSQIMTTTLLSTGTLINLACAEDDVSKPLRPSVRTQCTDDEARRLIGLLGRNLTASTEEWEKMVILQALSAIRRPEVIPIVAPLATDTIDVSDKVQSMALYALSEPSHESPDHVRQIVGPVMFNSDNPSRVRIAALSTYMASKPEDDHFYAKLAALTWSDEDDQFCNFIIQTLGAYANSTHPCTKSNSAHGKFAESITDDDMDLGIFGSQTKIFSDYLDEQGLATMLKMSWIAANNSMIPDVFYAEWNTSISGYSQQLFECALNMDGIETIIDKLIGPTSVFNHKNSLESILRDDDKDEPMGPRSIWQKLGLIERDQDGLDISLWIKTLTHQNRMFNFDGDDIMDMLKSGVMTKFMEIFQRKVPYRYQKVAYLADVIKMSPSPLGISIYNQMSIPAVFDVEGAISAKIGKTSENLPIRTLKSVQLNLEIYPTLAKSVVTTFGVINPFKITCVGAGARSKLLIDVPIEIELDIDIRNTKLDLKVKPSEHFLRDRGVTSLFKYVVQPYTVVYPVKSYELPSKFSKTIIVDEDLDKYEYKYGEKVLGTDLTLNIESDLFWQDQASNIDFLIESPLNLVSFWWATPDLKHRKYDLKVESNALVQTQAIVSIDINPLENKLTKLIMEGQQGLEGMWGLITGWFQLPYACEMHSGSEMYRPRFTTEYEEISPMDSGISDIYQQYGKHEYKPYYPKNPVNREEFYTDEYKPYTRSSSSSYGSSSYGSSSSSSYLENERSTSTTKIHKIPFEGVETVFGAVVDFHLMVKSARSETRKIEGQVEVKRDVKYRKDDVKLLVKVERPSSQLQVCANLNMVYPKVPCNTMESLNPELIKPIVGQASLKWGSSCQSPNHNIDVKLEFSKTPEQIQVERKGREWFMKDCKHDYQQGKKLSDACDEAVEEVSTLNKAVVEISYSQGLPDVVQNISYKALNLLKALEYSQMSLNPFAENPSNRLKLRVEFDEEDDTLDLVIKKPKETYIFENIYYPDYSDYIMPISARVPYYRRVLDDITEGYFPPTCKVMTSSIRTFDNNTYDFPLSPCKHVIAKDCTSSDLFSILMSRIDAKRKDLTVILAEHVIRVTPEDAHTGKFTVKVDEQSISSDKDYLHVVMHKEKVLAVIMLAGEYISIRSPYLNIWLRFDGENLRLMISNLYQGNVCGLCDEMTGDTDDSLVGPRQCEYAEPSDFAYQYAIPSSECSIPRPKAGKICPEDNGPMPKFSERRQYFHNPSETIYEGSKSQYSDNQDEDEDEIRQPLNKRRGFGGY